MINVNSLSFGYKGVERLALRGINLNVSRGDFVGIIGSSGAGKTTLARLLTGIIPHAFGGDFYGEALVDGKDTVKSSIAELSRVVSMVSGDVDSQFVTTMVEDEILFALENYKVDGIRERVTSAMDDLGIADLRERSLMSLSGGQKQKVAIACAVALSPSVLILDEATGELDPMATKHVFDLLKRMNETKGTTIIVIEQKIMTLCAYAKRLVAMHEGRVALDAAIDDALRNITLLQDIGVNVPRVATLAHLIHDLYSGKTPVTVEEARRVISEVLA